MDFRIGRLPESYKFNRLPWKSSIFDILWY